MKKILVMAVAFIALVGVNGYAEDTPIVEPNIPEGVDPYLCYWNGGAGDCDENGNIYCICGEVE